MFDLDDCIACVTSRGAKNLAERLERRLEPFNVTRVQWIAMYYVDKIKDLTQNQLAEKMMLKGPTVANLLDRMEKEGLVYREKSLTDKRVKNLKLTKKGTKLKEELIVVAENFKNDAISHISDKDLITYKAVLAKMLVNVK